MPPSIISTLNKAKKLITAGNLEKATSVCNKLLKKNPQQADALYLIGLIALRKKDYANAIEACKQSIALKPDKASTYSNLCLALTKSGDTAAAIEAGKKAVTLASDNATAHTNLASSYNIMGDFESSFKHQLKASQLRPRDLKIQFELGNMYVSRGEMKAARDCFKNIIKLDENHITAYGNLVRITKYKSSEHEDVRKLEAFIYQTQLSDTQRATVLFSLGKIYQDCEQFDKAFYYFKQGNKILDNKYQFNHAHASQAATLLINNCTNDLFTKKRNSGNQSETPIFIVGTPRSGSTLTEQILSSHPGIFGAGELSWFPETAEKLPQYLKTSTPYPKCLAELTDVTINKLATQYLDYTRTFAAGAGRIIDKMPGNFLHLGLIHILFPNAKIIHCRRMAKDACISMYCNQFPSGVPYSYNLYKLGAYVIPPKNNRRQK